MPRLAATTKTPSPLERIDRVLELVQPLVTSDRRAALACAQLELLRSSIVQRERDTVVAMIGGAILRKVPA